MTDAKKPREFWIDERAGGASYSYERQSYNANIHVREVMPEERIEFTDESMIAACGILETTKLERTQRALEKAKKFITEVPLYSDSWGAERKSVLITIEAIERGEG